MRRVSTATLEPDRIGEGSERLTLSDPLGTEGTAINRYRIAPGEGLPGGLHAHADQAETFVVLDGRATFDVWRPGERGERVTVDAGEAVRFEPGEFQTGRNTGEVTLDVLAVGAPRETDDTRVPARCPDCGRRGLRLDAGPDGVTFVCPDCGSEHAPARCPDCEGGRLEFELGGDRPVVVCRDCASRFDRAPLEE